MSPVERSYAVKTGGQLAKIIEWVGPKKHIFVYHRVEFIGRNYG